MYHHRLYHHAARGLIGLLSTLVAIVWMCAARCLRRSRRVRRGSIGMLGLLCLWACGGAPEGAADAREPISAPAPTACPGNGPTDAGVATATAAADVTACLIARCAPLNACGAVTSAKPVCVELHSAGGMLLDLYACPADGCCY